MLYRKPLRTKDHPRCPDLWTLDHPNPCQWCFMLSLKENMHVIDMVDEAGADD